MVEAKQYYEISDKETFWKLCRNRGLTVPENIEIDCWQGQPFVAKPKHYVSSDGKVYAPVIVETEEEYRTFIRNYRGEDFDLQEFVQGESFYLLYYFAKNGTVISFSQENIAQQPNGKSILAAVSRNLHTSEISGQFEALFKDQKFVGFVMIELRKCRERYYMIEANPRLWGPTQLYVDAGVPLIEAFLQDTGFMKEKAFTDQPCEAYYYWSGGRSAEKDCVWHGSGRQFFQDHWEDFQRADMYDRPDTINVYRMETMER